MRSIFFYHTTCYKIQIMASFHNSRDVPESLTLCFNYKKNYYCCHKIEGNNITYICFQSKAIDLFINASDHTSVL